MARSAFEGALALLVRRGLTMLLGLAGVIVVARYLDPLALGLYAVAATVLAVGLTLSDLGVTAALLRDPDKPDRPALRTLFAVELSRGLALLWLVWALAPLLGSFYGLDSSGQRLLVALVATTLPGLLCTVPSALLERQLAYRLIALADVVQAAAAQVALILGAIGGAGAWSFVLAALVGGCLRLPLIWLAAGRRLGFGWLGLSWQRDALRRMLHLGAPLQLGGLTHLLREHLPTLLAPTFYSLADLGYLRWAQRTPASAVQPLTQSLARVSLPALGRLQGPDDQEAARTLVGRLLLALLALLLPALALALALLPALIELVFTPRWAPAARAFGLYALALAIGEPVLLLASLCSALGLAWATLRALLVWALTQLALALLLAPLLGFEGVALAAALSALVPLTLLLRRLRERLGLRLWRLARGPMLAALAAFLTGYVLLPLAANLWGLALVAAGGGLVAGLLMFVVEKELR
jgi:PST family polysaccharide transporter